MGNIVQQYRKLERVIKEEKILMLRGPICCND